MFTSLNFMQRHMKYYCLTRTTNRTWDCKKCNKRFASMHYLKIHVCIDSKGQPHQNIKKKKAIGNHNGLSNTNTGKKPYQCIHCNKVFNMLHHLTTHLRTHTGEKPYQCTQCNKAFNQLGYLTTHLGTHTGEKPYQCAQCNKVLNKLHHLIRHLRTDTGEKPYRCTQ